MEEFREHFSPFFRDFVVERVHRLVREAERQPEYLKRREDVEDMCQVEHIQLNEAEKELFIYMVRSADEPIREVCISRGARRRNSLCGIVPSAAARLIEVTGDS